MKVVFTICSNNYLAQAKTLGNSLAAHAPSIRFIIVLCDKLTSRIDYSFLDPYEIIPVSDLGIVNFNSMCSQYNVVELNTSIKPFAFLYCYRKYSAESVFYFDPDIRILGDFDLIDKAFEYESILLTPHILTPIPLDGLEPTEDRFTQFGIYNLGFLGTKISLTTKALMSWWMERLEHNCYIRPEEGIFVDQLPMNFVPIFWGGVKIAKHFGFNMAPWNLHERELSLYAGRYLVNDEWPLVFYHFSNFKPDRLENDPFPGYSRAQTRITPTLRNLYVEYAAELLHNGFNDLIGIPCAYARPSVPLSTFDACKCKIKTMLFS